MFESAIEKNNHIYIQFHMYSSQTSFKGILQLLDADNNLFVDSFRHSRDVAEKSCRSSADHLELRTKPIYRLKVAMWN